MKDVRDMGHFVAAHLCSKDVCTADVANVHLDLDLNVCSILYKCLRPDINGLQLMFRVWNMTSCSSIDSTAI